MTGVFAAAWVIARRDFVATVWSRSFLLFLLAPIIAILFGVLISQMTKNADVKATQPTVAVAMEPESADAIRAAHRSLAEAIGALDLPELAFVDPEADAAAQARRLLASPDEDVSAVLIGSLERPVLVGPARATGGLGRAIGLVVNDARDAQALRAAGVATPTVSIATLPTDRSAGSVNLVRHMIARAGQVLIFALTLLLAGMLLSNLVEEKSNKVIEILAAAVPLDAVFLGKLIAMLGVSLIGVAIWGGLAGLGLLWIQDFISAPAAPAVGWPLYAILLVVYFAANYLLLGAVFLGIGGQASNVREVQTLSMPITFGQVMIFALASAAVGGDGGALALAAAIFPLSSPMTMISVAAENATLWWHFLAILWQLVWVVIIIRVSARLFRATVLKSQTREGFFDPFRKRRPSAPLAGE